VDAANIRTWDAFFGGYSFRLSLRLDGFRPDDASDPDLDFISQLVGEILFCPDADEPGCNRCMALKPARYTTGIEGNMITGETMVLFSGQEPTVVTLTFGVSEVERLREALRQVRPIGHDYLCEHDEGPDVWVDESDDPPIDGTAFRAVEWVAGVGLITTDKPVEPEAPYVGWCCSRATARHTIDAALSEDARETMVPRQ